MAATALVIVMNAMFVFAADAVPFISTDLVHLTLTFLIDSKIQMLLLWQKLHSSLSVFLLLFVPC